MIFLCCRFACIELFEYIEKCYEECHVQGDEANYSDMLEYLRGRGYR